MVAPRTGSGHGARPPRGESVNVRASTKRGARRGDVPARAPSSQLLQFSEWNRRLPKISACRLDLSVRVERKLRFKNPACYVLRGLFGERLRAALCPDHDKHRADQTCSYSEIFETGGVQGSQTADSQTKPYWFSGLTSRETVSPGELTIRLVMIGRALEARGEVVAAFSDALEALGRRRAVVIEGGEWHRGRLFQRPLPEATTWRLTTKTPLIVGVTPADAERSPSAPWLCTLVRAAKRRIRDLARAYGGPFDALIDYPDLREVELEQGGLGPTHQVRVRFDGTEFPLDGHAGEAILRGEGMRGAGPLLSLAAATSIGEHSSLGFGAYGIWPLDLRGE